jgi:hypothetical protein
VLLSSFRNLLAFVISPSMVKMKSIEKTGEIKKVRKKKRE